MPRTKRQKGKSVGEQKRETRTKKQKWVPMEKVDVPPKWGRGEIQPDSLPDRLQVKARMLSDSLHERRQALHKTMGGPLKASELPPAERKQQYKDMISSRELLIKALAGAAIVGRDGRLRISTAMVDAFRELSDA